MVITALTNEHLAELLELCQVSMPSEHWTLAALAQRGINGPPGATQWSLALWQTGKLIGALIGGVRTAKQPATAHINLLAIHPKQQRRGYATQLLHAFEDHARHAQLTRLRVGGGAPGYLWPGLDPQRYTTAYCFWLRHGFVRSGETCNLHVDLSSNTWTCDVAEESLRSAGWFIRRLEPRDRAQFARWLQATWGAGWTWEGLASYMNTPISTFVALQNETIKGFASYGVSGFDPTFGPTGVTTEARGHGLGTILLYRCLADIRKLGYQQAEIGWVGPVAFYHHAANATIGRIYWFLEKNLL